MLEIMIKKKSQEEFVSQIKKIFGDKYDYSKVMYGGYESKVALVCPIHGDFNKKASELLRGHGCQKCAWKKRGEQQIGQKKRHKIVCGVGLCDCITIDENGKRLKSYDTWINMMLRCYPHDNHRRQPTYIGCEVCDEWKTFSVFKKWFDENYVEGYQLDKDLIAPKEKIYSPQTCEFVPDLINHITSRCSKTNRCRSKYGLGVRINSHRFIASITEYGRALYIGSYSTKEEAQKAYKNEKERYIKEVAESYYKDGKITKRIYGALMNYEVGITD